MTKDLDALRCALSEWLPIESAPRDGSVFLARGGVYHGIPFPLRWSPSEFGGDQPWVSVITGGRLYAHCATHWMPLPVPPAQSEHSAAQTNSTPVPRGES